MLFVLDGSKSFRGSEVTLFKAIANHLNFDYIIREPKTPGWGNISSGMAGEMTMGLSDVAWSQMYFSIWKWQFHDVTTSYDDSQHCLMVNREKIRCDWDRTGWIRKLTNICGPQIFLLHLYLLNFCNYSTENLGICLLWLLCISLLH